VGTGIIWSKADLKLGAIDRGSGGCCDKCVEVAKPDFNKSLSHNPFLEFQGASKKLYSTTSNDVSHLMQASFLVDPTFKK